LKRRRKGLNVELFSKPKGKGKGGSKGVNTVAMGKAQRSGWPVLGAQTRRGKKENTRKPERGMAVNAIIEATGKAQRLLPEKKGKGVYTLV